jgi:pimeloyl-ACP methyl ester carboxylesterase
MTQTNNIYPHLRQHLTPTTSGSTVCSYTSDLGPNTPILTLVHGYPESAFVWRHVIPELIDKVSLFVPELPGYGISTACNQHDRKTVGGALLEALTSVFKISSPRKVILVGHDRGARTCHRLAVDKADFPALNIVGTVLIDIMPTKVQWEAFATPAVAVGYFHWPLLANPEIAIPMIKAYGGHKWAMDAFSRIQGGSEIGRKRFASDNAWEVYAQLFDKEETIVGSCEDYASGAQPEVTAQTEDQKNGKKIAIPTVVIFSKAKLGSTGDIAEIWKDWIEPGTDYEAIAVGDGHGHYLPEEACDWVSDALKKFVEKVG